MTTCASRHLCWMCSDHMAVSGLPKGEGVRVLVVAGGVGVVFLATEVRGTGDHEAEGSKQCHPVRTDAFTAGVCDWGLRHRCAEGACACGT